MGRRGEALKKAPCCHAEITPRLQGALLSPPCSSENQGKQCAARSARGSSPVVQRGPDPRRSSPTVAGQLPRREFDGRAPSGGGRFKMELLRPHPGQKPHFAGDPVPMPHTLGCIPEQFWRSPPGKKVSLIMESLRRVAPVIP